MTYLIASHLLALCAGVAFGAVYLWLLWYGVRLLTVRSDLLLFILTGVLRISLLVAALAGGLALGATSSLIAVAVIGFVWMRIAATRVVAVPQTGAMEWK